MEWYDILLYALIGIVLAACIVGIYYAVRGFVPGVPTYQGIPSNVSSGLDDNQATFMFFYTTWCPWCKKAQPIWSSFKESLKTNPKTYGGYTVNFEDINAENDKGKSALYQVDAYPTYKLQTKDKIYEYKGAPSVDAFRTFLASSLGKEETP
jgi:thiol-disulfide isomerase/thioredoxin